MRPALAGNLPDEALLAAMAGGDAEAGVAFVRRFQGRVYGLALAVVGDPGTAEDVAQETFVRAWRHASVYDLRRGKVATWLLTIARNLAIDAVRLHKAAPVDPATLGELFLPASDPSPEDEAMRAGSLAGVRAALATVPADQRRALLLAAFYGRTAAEIAAGEAIPLATAKTRIRSGLIRLRAALSVAEA